MRNARDSQATFAALTWFTAAASMASHIQRNAEARGACCEGLRDPYGFNKLDKMALHRHAHARPPLLPQRDKERLTRVERLID